MSDQKRPTTTRRPDSDPLNYSNAGVDIAAGNALVERIKPLAAKTQRPGVMAGIGGFGGLFELPVDRFRQPILVSGTDGVGTKLKLAIDTGIHHTIGIDLVAMCANDIVVLGAEPLFFLDYYATGALDQDVAASVVAGIADGCLQAGTALIGGETAEMPGMYSEGDYDLAGFCVGIVEKDAIIDGTRVEPGDQLIALASSGPHSNGYSLIRKIVERSGAKLTDKFGASSLGETLLAPTTIYVNDLLQLYAAQRVHAVAHITGGGLIENIPRVLSSNLQARLDKRSWQLPEIFQWLQNSGNVTDDDMHLTFNCGVGMIIVVPPTDIEPTLALLNRRTPTAWHIGEVIAADSSAPKVVIQ